MHQYNYRHLDTTPPLQVRESSGSNFGRLLACTETPCNKHHVREQPDLNPGNAGSCICADTRFHAFSGWQWWEPLQQPGKPTQNLVHDKLACPRLHLKAVYSGTGQPSKVMHGVEER